ncbi:hypothetical protein FB446DRAFT_283884 [Lentinula raphanica]|nr:hypothetical protein FB446DRAFT_283884 [Lentinula raphanica]
MYLGLFQVYTWHSLHVHSLVAFILFLSIIVATIASPLQSYPPGELTRTRLTPPKNVGNNPKAGVPKRKIREKVDHDIRECSLNSGLHFKQDSECYDGCSTARKYIITVACRSKWTNIDEACKGGKAEGSVPTLDPEAIWTVGLRPEGSVRIQQGFRTQRNPHSPPGWIAVGPNGLVPSVSNSAQTKFINLGYVIMSMKTKIQISIEVNQELKRHYSDTLPNIFYAHHTLTYYNSWLHKLLRVPKGDQKVIELSFDILNDWKKPYFDVMLELKGTAAGSIVKKEDYDSYLYRF